MREMPLSCRVLSIFLGIGLLLCLPSQGAQAGAADAKTANAGERSIVVFSDLHMGIGKKADGSWYETEDFRWPRALEGFLTTITAESGGEVDLVVAGDFLELWQPPPGIVCTPPGRRSNYGCSKGQMIQIVKTVIAAHPAEFAALRKFAETGDNCLYVVPGNHDASLVDDQIWGLVETALKSEKGCVHRVRDGSWSSEDGKIWVEHGHQMGKDLNRYHDWPEITAEFSVDGSPEETYFRRPWGEAFVQAIYNAEETALPILDNLSPGSAGARYRLAQSGVAGKAKDVARFLRFNLLETSLRHKDSLLGREGTTGVQAVSRGRRSGHKLFLAALPEDDPLAVASRADSPAAESLRTELDELTKALDDDEIRALCDLADRRGEGSVCQDPVLGAGVEAIVFSRARVVRAHVKGVRAKERRLRQFVYGHTHSFELPSKVKVFNDLTATVSNSGAFQRVIDDERFQREAKSRGVTPTKLLETLTLEELPACYTSVLVKDGEVEVRAWLMPEDGEGEFISPCDSRCPSVGHGCSEKEAG